VYLEIAQGPAVDKVKHLEDDVRVLNERLQTLQQYLLRRDGIMNGPPISPTSSALTGCQSGLGVVELESSSMSFSSPQSWDPAVNRKRYVSSDDTNRQSEDTINVLRSPSFKIRYEHVGDVVTRNLIGVDSAAMYFQNFFMGCDRFVPVFDPHFDTFDSVRGRSSMLFDTICTVGCKMTTGPSSQVYQLLNKDSKTRVCEVLVGSVAASLESIQSLLIVASYSEKGCMLTSIATRMAMQLDLPGAYEEAIKFASAMGSSDSRGWASNAEVADSEVVNARFRKARTWLGLFVLEHIFSIDCGKPPGIEAQVTLRRCRILVSHPSRTSLDLRLLSQVELNSLRAVAHSKLSIPNSMPDIELATFIQGMKIDLDI
jgi:hypothetical protein